LAQVEWLNGIFVGQLLVFLPFAATINGEGVVGGQLRCALRRHLTMMLALNVLG